jgi:hypothetical protein
MPLDAALDPPAVRHEHGVSEDGLAPSLIVVNLDDVKPQDPAVVVSLILSRDRCRGSADGYGKQEKTGKD